MFLDRGCLVFVFCGGVRFCGGEGDVFQVGSLCCSPVGGGWCAAVFLLLVVSSSCVPGKCSRARVEMAKKKLSFLLFGKNFFVGPRVGKPLDYLKHH